MEKERKYILTLENFKQKKYNKINEDENDNLNRSLDTMDKFNMSSKVENVKRKLSKTNDLWEVDKLGSYVEGIVSKGNEGEFTAKDYDNFHRVLVPDWIDKNWNNGIKFDGSDLRNILSGYSKSFEKYLNEKGFDSQEVYISYIAGSGEPDSEYSIDGEFTIAFDIWKEDNRDENGWVAFKFNISKWGSTSPKIEDLEPIEDDFRGYINHTPQEGTASGVISLGKGTFYNYNLENSPGDLPEMLGDGGYILRKD